MKKPKSKKIKKVKNHYKEVAKKWRDSKQATMRDVNIRDKEVEKIIEWIGNLRDYVTDDPLILEVGCGNGYTSEQITKNLDVKLVGVDFCEDFIDICNKRNLKDVEFLVGDVLNLPFEDNRFDVVFTERCLINLVSWEDQKKALNEIRRVLKRGGFYIMIESFTDGLDNLNQAQEALGLDPKLQPAHDRYFNKSNLLGFLKDGFERFCDEGSSLDSKKDENFLSSYYFGSRVIYPALIRGHQNIVYNNKFVEFFRHLPSFGAYSTIQFFVFRKVS